MFVALGNKASGQDFFSVSGDPVAVISSVHRLNINHLVKYWEYLTRIKFECPFILNKVNVLAFLELEILQIKLIKVDFLTEILHLTLF